MSTPERILDPAIHRVPLDKLTIHEITEAELEALERGSPESLFLNLAIAVLSVAVSFSAALATTQIESIWTFCVFVILCVVGYLAGITFGLLWLQSRKSLKSVARAIRSRNPAGGIQQPTSEANPIS